MPAVEVRILGPVELVVAGHVKPVTAAKVRALLAMLALDANVAVSSDALADRLWSGTPPATAGSVLRTYISQLRAALADDAARLARVGDGYRLDLATEELDARRFENAVGAVRAATAAPPETVRVLRDALSLWRGRPLPELADDQRAAAEVARLESCRWSAVEALADAELELGMHEEVAADLAATTLEDPLREQVVRRLMLALYRCGRQGQALAAYERLRRGLLDELGLDPSPELQRVQAQILAQDPALDAPGRTLTNLPASLTSLVGRDSLVEQVLDHVDSHRLVTLVGSGGAGKTRLALEVAARATTPADGGWFIELAARRDGSQVAPAVLAALEIPQQPDAEPVSTLLQALAHRQVLLVLDNCEHLLRDSAALAAALLQGCTGVQVLATSRSPLGVPGELVVPVPPLEVPAAGADLAQIEAAPATQLLRTRIMAARGGRAPDASEWPALAELCRRLDGLPLALELIAARAAVFSVDDLAGSVQTLITGAEGTPTGPDHHRSVVASVGWSLRLLQDEQRRVLQRLCLLPGSFSVAAAAAVAGCELPALLDDLAHLAQQSLLEPVVGRQTRFRVLEPVRQVVVGTLDRRQAQDALDRLASWSASRVEQAEGELRGPGAAAQLDELEADIHLLHAAMDHALVRDDPTDGVRIAAALSGLWAYRGYLVEGDRRLSRALERSASVAAALQVRLLLAAGTHCVTLGDLDRLREHVGAALALGRSSADTADLLRALLWAARGVLLQGELTAAAELYEEALAKAQAVRDDSSRASALAGLGDVAAARGDVDGAADLHLRSLGAFRGAGDAHGEGQALLNVAETDRVAGRLRAAEDGFHGAAEVFRTIADRSCTTASTEGLARVARDAGDLPLSESRYRQALAARRELKQERLAAADLTELADVLARSGRSAEAAEALGAAGEEEHPLAHRLREALGTRAYLQAWARGRAAAPRLPA